MPEPRVIREALEIVTDIEENALFKNMAEARYEWDVFKNVQRALGASEASIALQEGVFFYAFWVGMNTK